MSRKYLKRCLELFGFVVILALAGCKMESPHLDGVPVTPEMLESVSYSLAVEASSVEPAQTQVTTAISISETTSKTNAPHTTAETTSKINSTTETISTTIAPTTVQENTTISEVISETSVVSLTEQTEPETTAEQSNTTSKTVEITEPSVSEDPAEAVYEVVYWTEGGSVYHITDQCSTLRRSKTILSGTVEEALNAKKERPCKTCTK